MIQKHLHVIILSLFVTFYLIYCLYTWDMLYMSSQAILCVPFFLNYFFWVPWLLKKNSVLYWSLWVVFYWTLNLTIYIGFFWANWEMKPDCDTFPFLHLFAGGVNGTFFLAAISTGSRLTKEWFINQKRHEELIVERQMTELQTLKSKINLPFVLNVLSKMEKKAQEGPTQISDSIISLSNILRHGLYESKSSYIALESELKVLGDYLKLVNCLETKRSLIIQKIDEVNLNIPPTLLIRLLGVWIENIWKNKEGEQTIGFKVEGNQLKLIFSNKGTTLEEQNSFKAQFPMYRDEVSEVDYKFNGGYLEVEIVDLTS